jgi:hypothetical protein
MKVGCPAFGHFFEDLDDLASSSIGICNANVRRDHVVGLLCFGDGRDIGMGILQAYSLTVNPTPPGEWLNRQ